MGIFSWLFGTSKEVAPLYARPLPAEQAAGKSPSAGNNRLHFENDDIISCYEFYANQQLRTPLSVLEHHGETFRGPPSEAPKFFLRPGDGCWAPKLKSWAELGIPLRDLPESSTTGSDIGQVVPSDYLPFLKAFRHVVEADLSDDEKLAKLAEIPDQSPMFRQFWERHRAIDPDFPQSFFFRPLMELPGVGAKTAKALYDAGLCSVSEVSEADESALLAVKGVGPRLMARLKEHGRGAHSNCPKQGLKGETEAEFLSSIAVPTTVVSAPYRKVQEGKREVGRWVGNDGNLVTVERLAELNFRERDCEVIRCEQVLISAWVATFLGVAIQDRSDPLAQEVMRNSTVGWSPQRRDAGLIRFVLPADFGLAGYYPRRKEILESWFAGMQSAPDLAKLFDALLAQTEFIRDYLWVAEPSAVEAARRALTVLPSLFIVESVRWAIQDFWNRRPGWPDLFVYDSGGYRFVEVKSPNDRLSQEQMNWFKWAVQKQRVPCELLRVKPMEDKV